MQSGWILLEGMTRSTQTRLPRPGRSTSSVSLTLLPEWSLNQMPMIGKRVICRSVSSPMSAKEWSLRLEIVSREMPWLMPSVAKLQKETVSTANWTDLWVLCSLTEAEKRRILFAKMPPSWHRTIQLTDTSRELQDRADIAIVTSHLATLESLEKADRLRSTRITGRSFRAGRISTSTRPTSRQQNCRRFPQRQPYGGQSYNPSTYPRYQQPQQLQSGGRPGYPTRPAFGRGQGFNRSNQGRPQYGQGYPNRGRRPQQRSFGGQRGGFGRSSGQQTPAARPNDQFYWQEEAGQYDDGYYPEEAGQAAEEAHMTEEERALTDQWNDNMFVSSDTANEGWYSAEEQYAVEEQVEQEAYYGEEDPGSASEVYEDAYEEDPRWLNQARSEASSDEEEEGSEDEEDDDEDQQPAPSSVINISICNKKTQHNELFRVLLDSGTLGCLATAEAVKRAGIKQQTATKPKSFRTAAGRFHTTHYAQVRQHRILELNSKRKLQRLKVNVAPGPLGLYDFILGRRYMTRYGIDLLFSQQKIEWDGMQMPMRRPEEILSKEPTTYEKKLAVRENMLEDDDLTAATDLDTTDDEFEDDYGDSELADASEEHFAQHIADAQYAKADLESIAKSQK